MAGSAPSTVQVSFAPDDRLRVLIGDQAAGDLGRRLRGNHGLGAVARVAAPDAVDVEGRPRPGALQRGEAGLAALFAETDLAEKATRVEAEPAPRLSRRRVDLADRVVEARHRHLALVVVQGGEQPAQRIQGIEHRPSVHARVQVAAGAFEIELEVDEAAQPGRQRRRLDVPHGRVADDAEVRAQLLGVGLEKAVERRAAALLLAFEKDRDLAGQAAGHVDPGTERLEEGGHLALVVDGTARDEPLAVRPVDERRLEGRGGP
jgi:hypothetical protein